MIENKILKIHYVHGLLWFRIFGYGLLIKNITKSPLLLSQREKLKNNYVLFGHIYFEWLAPIPVKGLCGICNLPVCHSYPWWTGNPGKQGTKPLHESCAAIFFGWDRSEKVHPINQ